MHVWKIADFGFAAEGSSKKTIVSTVGRGTSGYRAPELLQDTPVFTRKVDIWAAGCIFYEIVARQKAFLDDWQVKEYGKDASKEPKIPDITFHYAGSELFFRETVRKTIQIDWSKRPKAKALSHDFESFRMHLKRRNSYKSLEAQTHSGTIDNAPLASDFVSTSLTSSNSTETSVTPIARAKTSKQPPVKTTPPPVQMVQKTIRTVESERPKAKALSHDLKSRDTYKPLKNVQTSRGTINEARPGKDSVSTSSAFLNSTEPPIMPTAQAKTSEQPPAKDAPQPVHVKDDIGASFDRLLGDGRRQYQYYWYAFFIVFA